MKKYNIIAQIIFSLVFCIITSTAIAITPPDTIIIAGPGGSTASSDVVFWWTGKVSTSDNTERLPSIKGFYYSLDGELWNWTQDRFIAYYNIPGGSHSFYVKAVDSNDQQDASPAFRTFAVEQSYTTEPNEGQRLFTIDPVFQDELNNKVISTNLIQAFGLGGITLSTNAVVEVYTNDSEWQITDGNKAYFIKKENDLNVYGTINDSASTALAIPIGKTVRCQSFTAKDGVDEDWFKVNVTRVNPLSPIPRQITVILNRPDVLVSSIVKVYRFPDTSAGKEIASFEVRDKGFFTTGVTQGDYFINVKPTTVSAASSYSLSVAADTTASEVIWDTEDNSSSNNATETSPMFLSKTTPWMQIVGNKWSASDNKDWFRVHVDLNERKRMSLNFTRPQVGSATIRLYSAYPMSQLGEFTVTPDSGTQWKLDVGVGLGDYLIEADLSNYNSTGSDIWGTPYFLTLLISDIQKGEVWELEPNNSPDFADRLPIGTRVRAAKNQPNDTDWFRMTVPHDGILSLTASRILKNGSVNVYLLDSVGQPISEFNIQSGEQKNTFNTNITTGEYLVNTDFTDFSGEYWLTAMLITSVDHSVPADTPLSIWEKISVKLVWEKGNSANFDILYDNLSKRLNTDPVQMYDDGLHNDGNANDGIYAGTYVVKDKDNAKDAVVVVHIYDIYSNSSDIPIPDKPILIDTNPPVINQVSHDAGSPLSIGMELTVTIKGEAGNTANFDVIPDSKDTGMMRLTGLPAYDDGKHNDGAENDGIYVGTYTVKGDDYITDGIVTGYLADKAGNVSNLSAVIKVDIVGDHPVINSVEHTGRTTLGKDDTLTVTMIGDSEGIASFDINGLISGVPMYDDGQHNDDSQGDGKYVGSYKVVENDGILSAPVVAHLVDRKGRSSSRTALVKVNIDAVPPSPVTTVEVYDRPNDQGGYITIKWKSSTEIDFAHYNIYLSKDVPIAVSKDRPIDVSPIKTDITDSKRTSVDIKVDANSEDYYVAVSAVDIIGNESILDKGGKSVAGPAQAEDNLRPSPVKIVKAVDRDKDFGGVIILSWTDTNNDDDFARYNIYQDTKPITSTEGLKPIDTITDRLLKVIDIQVDSDTIDYYFAVTSVDLSDNESELDKAGGSASGPVMAVNNIGVEPEGPLTFLSGPIGTIHHNHVAFHWNRFETTNEIRGYYIRLDDGSWQWTTDSKAVFYNLSAGDHKFAVRLPESLPNFTIERSFTVVPVSTSEQEPNNSPDTASKLITGVIIRGSGEDDDWYRVHVPSSSSPCIMDVLLSYTGTSGKVSIYSDQPFRQTAESESNGSNPINLTFGTLTETDYLINVQASAQYRLVATINKLPKGYLWETESNDQPEDPDYLTINGSSLEIGGALSLPSDSDWYKIHVSESLAGVSNLSILQYSGLPVVMKIYSSPLESDQIGEISDNNGYFTGVVKPGADYFINMSGENASYQFLLTMGKIPTDQENTWEVEPNDLIVQASPIALWIKQHGTNWDGNNDNDVYKLSLEKDGITNLQFSRPSGIGSSVVEVLNASSQVIGSFSVDVSSAQKGSINLDVKAGTYYVKVRPQNESPSAEYVIVAMFVESIKLTYQSPDGTEILQGVPLKAGDSIVLEMKWNVKGKASFSIGEDESRIVQMNQLDDGVYRGSYTIVKGDDISNAPITLHIEDNASNKAEIKRNVGIVDSILPGIIEVSHDADTPLSAGRTLSVRMIGEPKCRAKFNIAGFKNDLDMYNMSSTEAKPLLAILNWNWRYDPTYGTKGSIVIYGEVKNISDTAQDLVRINYTLYDGSGETVNSGYGYTAPNRIPPGVVSSFKIFSDYTGNEKSAKIQLAFGSDQNVAGEVNDGYSVYTGIYDVGANDNVQNAFIVCYLTDTAGNQSSASAGTLGGVSGASAPEKVTFDNIPPVIKSLSYNADKVFVEGDIITVYLEGEADCDATFNIGDFRTSIQMSALGGGASATEKDTSYVGTYRVRAGDKVSGALITGYLKDKAGNTSTYVGTQSININTSAPGISSISLNTLGRPFIENETITITANTEIGVVATFNVENLISNRPMFDDGKHDDGEAGDGTYAGSYTIKKGDNVKNAKVKVSTLSTNGKSVERFALETVSVDTTPPLAVVGVNAVDKPNDNGGYIILSWTPSSETEFLEYRIYQSDQFITSVQGLTPLDITINDLKMSSIEVKVPFQVLDSPIPSYYFALTAVDTATNESPLGQGSVTGPVFSVDNLPPLPVSKVSGYDREFDYGKVIVITWSQSCVAEDFHNYNIYMGKSAVDVKQATLVDSSITDRNVRIVNVTVSENDIPLFFIVTAVDNSGNESDITENSVVGPLSAIDNLGVEPDTIVRIISGPVGEINYSDVTFRWRRWFSNANQSSLPGYYYKLDDDNWVWTNDTSKTYNDLREGRHTFYVRADLGTEGVDPMSAVRVFSVKRITLLETEPNNNAEQADWIPKGMTIAGANKVDGVSGASAPENVDGVSGASAPENDNDWYKFHVESGPVLMTLHFDRIRGNGTTNVTVFKSLPPTPETALCSVKVDPLNSHSSVSTGVDLGDYFIIVDLQGEDSDAKYELSVTADELSQSQTGDIVQWDKEINDFPLLAQLAGRWSLDKDFRSVEVSGSGNRDGDVDWYKLQITGLKPDVTTFMRIDFVRPRATGSTEVSLYGSLPLTETPKIGFINYTPDLLPVQTISVPVKSGDYYVKVDNLQNVNSIYSLRISFSLASEKWELEPNSVSQFANTLPLNEVIKGTSWDPDNDTDWFRVRLDERKTLVVSLFRPFGKGSTDVTLKSSDLADVTSASTSVLTGQKATISANLNLGDYFVVLKPSGENDPSAEYELVATALETKFTTKVSADREQTPNTPLSIGDSINLNVKWLSEITITFDVGDLRTGIPMYDDGKHGDSQANDGIYSGTYTIQAGDDLSNGTISLHLGMSPAKQRWTADFILQDPITGQNVSLNIDTTSPKIFSVDHDMPIKPLSEGKALKVTMTGEANAKDAFFSIQLPSAENYFNASEILMNEDPEGTYTGSYTVIDGDNLDSGVVVSHLIDVAGNESVKSALRPVFFDTTPPEIISIEHNANKVLVDGDVLIVKAVTDTKKGKATFSIGELVKSLPMYDVSDDQVADDGIYTGRYTVKKGDNVTDAAISVQMVDEAGNTSETISRNPVSIDTTPPEIISFVHNAKDIISQDDKLIVTLKGDPGNTATFDIGDFKIGLPMYDDGTRGDEEAGDGTYIGTYVVQKADSVKDARITGYLTSKNGNQSISRIFERVSIDAVPPLPVMGVKAFDKPEDQGYWIVLTWNVIQSEGDFDHYNVYRESAPISSLLGLIPLVDNGTMNLGSAKTDSAEVNVPTNKTDYYFAVTAVDTAGNESPLDTSSGSTFGAVQAIDNIPPASVSIVSAVDRPKDQGRTIIVSWTNPSHDKDFDHYAIYSSREPIKSLKDLKPVMQATNRDLLDIPVDSSENSNTPRQIGVYVTVSFDGMDFYFAVTAVDRDGNESVLDSNGGSVAGPVKSKDDTPPKPVILIEAADTPDDNGGFLDVTWIPAGDEEIQQYNFYVSRQFIDNKVIKTLYPMDVASGEMIEPVKNTQFVKFKLKVPSEPVYVAITAVDFGANESSLDEFGNSVMGFVQAVSNIVKVNTNTQIFAGFDSDTSVLIPTGTFESQETVDILWPDATTFQKIDEANKFLETSHIDPAIDFNFSDTVREFKTSNSLLRKSVTITLSYADVTEMKNSETLSQDSERQFRIFRLNDASRLPKWELVSGQQKVDTIQNIVSAHVDRFGFGVSGASAPEIGVFRIAKLQLPVNLNKVIVYPNPFIPSQSISGYITFRNLTENVTIQIYSVDGKKVKAIEKIGGGDDATWNALNDSGDEVANGTYVFVIQNGLDTFTGKIIILR